MPRFMFGTDDPREAQQILTILHGTAAGSQAITGPTALPSTPTPPAISPAPRPTALPQGSGMPPNAAAPPPPPMPAAPAASANPRLESVVKLMDAYAKANKGVASVRAVLDVVGLKRAQDADEAQLIWLEQAFANTAWTPG